MLIRSVYHIDPVPRRALTMTNPLIPFSTVRNEIIYDIQIGQDFAALSTLRVFSVPFTEAGVILSD